jgi:hypothetical protein
MVELISLIIYGYVFYFLGIAVGSKTKDNKKAKCITHNTDWYGKCFECGEQVYTQKK